MSDLNRVVELIKDGDTSQARLILLDILATDRQSEQAWLYLAACAQNKTEFEESVKRVLTLNPFNAQALRLAESNKIDLPEAAKEAQKQEKKRKRAQKKAAAERSQVRPLIYLLLSLVVGAGAFLWYQDSTSSDAPAPTAESGTSGEQVAEGGDTATPTEAPTETNTPTPEPTATTLPVLDDPLEYVSEARVMSGTEDDLTAGDVFAPDASLSVVIEVDDHGEPLTLTVDLVALTGPTQTISTQEILLAGPAETVVLPVSPRGPTWQPGNWAAQLQINGEALPGLQFRIAAPTTPTPSATPRVAADANQTEEASDDATDNATDDTTDDTTDEDATEESAEAPTDEQPTNEPTQAPTETPTRTPTATQTPTPTEIPIDPTTRLVYDENIFYIINITDEMQDISELLFVQQQPDGTAKDFSSRTWQQGDFRGEGSVFSLQPDSCFQLGVTAGTAATAADECVRLNTWRQAGVLERFWLPVDGGEEVFLVLLDAEELIECEIDAGVCEFELPEVEDE